MRVFLIIYLIFSFIQKNQCYNQYNIKEVSKWKSSDITNKEKFQVQNIINDEQIPVNQSLQLSDSNIIFSVFGQKESKSDSIYNQQLIIFDRKGQVTNSKVFENLSRRDSTALSLTNVKEEFVFVQQTEWQCYMTFYDEKLNVKRGIQNVELGTVADKIYAQPIISMGKDFLYILMVYIDKDKDQLNIQIKVLDLSDTSTYKVLETNTYTKYNIKHMFANLIQAYDDDSALAQFYAKNDKGENIIVQLKFNSKGKLKSGYPKELNTSLNLTPKNFYWQWYSILHEDKKTFTYMASDNEGSLMIQTLNKKGNQICSKIFDISQYESYNYFYGIYGEEGWLYLQDISSKQGHFIIFDPNNCSLNLENISSGTGWYLGIVGSFLDKKDKQVLIIEVGNQQDSSQQETYQAKLHKIGSFEVIEDEDDNNFIIRFSVIFGLSITLLVI